MPTRLGVRPGRATFQPDDLVTQRGNGSSSTTEGNSLEFHCNRPTACYFHCTRVIFTVQKSSLQAVAPTLDPGESPSSGPFYGNLLPTF
jgi:hypothetical protein